MWCNLVVLHNLFACCFGGLIANRQLWPQILAKEDRVRIPRKELFRNTLRKAAHAYKTILELGLTGTFFSSLQKTCEKLAVDCKYWKPWL